jgi:hypothetical protein
MVEGSTPSPPSVPTAPTEGRPSPDSTAAPAWRGVTTDTVASAWREVSISLVGPANTSRATNVVVDLLHQFILIQLLRRWALPHHPLPLSSLAPRFPCPRIAPHELTGRHPWSPMAPSFFCSSPCREAPKSNPPSFLSNHTLGFENSEPQLDSGEAPMSCHSGTGGTTGQRSWPSRTVPHLCSILERLFGEAVGFHYFLLAILFYLRSCLERRNLYYKERR